jgi:hypothetical protein
MPMIMTMPIIAVMLSQPFPRLPFSKLTAVPKCGERRSPAYRIVPIAPDLVFIKRIGGFVGLGCAGLAQNDKVDAWQRFRAACRQNKRGHEALPKGS